jgi:hypothetical protein
LHEGNVLLHNAVPLCRSCNTRKKRKPPEQFYDPVTLLRIEALLRKTRELFEAKLGVGKAL